MYSTGFSSTRGRLTFRLAIRSTTFARDRKGESSTNELTSQEYSQANIIAQRLPMLLPHSTSWPTAPCLRTSCSSSRMSKTQFTPQVRTQGSELPLPSMSKATRLKLKSGISYTSGSAYNFEPPLPWMQSTVWEGWVSGCLKRNPSRRLPLRLVMERSVRTTYLPLTSRVWGPYAVSRDLIWMGLTIFFQAYSYTSIQIGLYYAD